MKLNSKQMTLGELISYLKRKDPELSVYFDFVHFQPAGLDSYRGYYEDLAIGYTLEGDECKVKDLLAKLEQAVGATFEGYKGGSYEMSEDTALWVANRKESGGTAIVDVVEHHSGCMVLKTEKID